MDAGVGLEADDESEVGQVHPRRDLAALVPRLRRQAMGVNERVGAGEDDQVTVSETNVC